MEVNDARLLACGYTRYQPTAVTPDGITDLYQKAVRDAGGRICYFIDVQKWAGWVHPYTGEKIEPSYEFEAYFEDKKTGKPLRILLYSGWDIDEAEKYIEVIFNLGLWKEYDTGE
ncbi:MAG: hypothetical protein J5933_03245 [Clostridia bacterium]|nr:hypothetical protein [Clostridia bacterium]